MGSIFDKAADVYRDFKIAGVPASGPNEPAKSAIRSLFASVDGGVSQLLAAFVADQAVAVYATKASLNADLAHPANALGIVYGDGLNNGVYVKNGPSGTGSWDATGLMLRGEDGDDGAPGKSFYEIALEVGYVPPGTTEAQFINAVAGEVAASATAVAVSSAASAADDAARAETAGTIAQFYSLPVYDTKAAANAALGTIAEGAKIGVEADESRSGARTVYRKTSGALVFLANLSQILQPVSVTYATPVPDSQGNNSQTLLRRPSPAGDGWGDFRLSASGSALTNNGNYVDNGIFLASNSTVGWSKLDPTKPLTRFGFEERYWSVPHQAWGAEFHIARTSPQQTGEVRAISIFIPHNDADWKAGDISFANSAYRFFDSRGAFGSPAHIQWEIGPGADADLTVGFQIGHGTKTINSYINGYAHTQQATADGSGTISLPYINGRDEEQHAAAQFIGAPPVANIFGQRALFTTLIDNPVDGDSVLYSRMSGDPVAGTLYSRQHYADADEFSDRMFNGKSGGRVVHHLYALTGDAFDRFEAPSRTMSAGLRYNDSRYVIGRGSDLSDELFGIDRATGRAKFAGPVGLPSYAVADLPAASTTLTGSMAFCTNEAGGAVPVFCDGSAWRRVTDRAVAA